MSRFALSCVLCATTIFVGVAQFQSAQAQSLVKTAPPEVLDTEGQPGARIDPDAPALPNWPRDQIRDIPTQLDWRNYDGNSYVSGIRDQGTCGSCWDFAAVAMLESQSMIHLQQPNTDPDFSEQFVLSCIDGANDCIGGHASHACAFLQSTGTPNESCMAYEDDDTVPCDDVCPEYQDQLHRIALWWYVTTSVYDPAAIKQALQIGPVVTWMRIHEDFHDLRDWSIYDGEGSSYTGKNHQVLIVGYDDTEACWIAKNSYGTKWGQDGFFRIAYDNACWFGLHTIVGTYDPPATNIDLQVTLEDMQPTYSDYEVEVRVYGDNDNLLTYIPFSITTSRGQVIESDPDTGGFGIGRATIRTHESGAAVIAVTAVQQTASINTTFVVGVPEQLTPIGSITEPGNFDPAAVTWSPDGNTLAIAYYSGTTGLVQYIDVNTWTIRSSLNPGARAFGLAYNPVGSRLVVAHSGRIAIYDPETGTSLDETNIIGGNASDSRSTYWPTDTKIITPHITSGDDRLCVLSSSLNLLASFTVGSFSSAGYSVAGNLIHLSTNTGTDQVKCYYLSNNSHRHTFSIDDPLSAAANPSGTRLAIARRDDDIGVYNTANWNLVTTITGAFDDLMAFMSWSSDPTTFAGIDWDSNLWVFDYNEGNDSGTPIGTRFVGGNGRDGMVAWHPGGLALAVLAPGAGVKVFAPRDGFDPVLTVNSPADGATVTTSSVQLQGSASDANGVRAVIATCGAWSEADTDLSNGFDMTVPLDVGANQIVVRTVDGALRSAESEIHVERLEFTDVGDEVWPTDFVAYPCTPNPANPGTVIEYSLPDTRSVSIAVYDITGRMVRRLMVNELQTRGRHHSTWHGRDEADRAVASGVYFCRIVAGTEQQVQRVSLVR